MTLAEIHQAGLLAGALLALAAALALPALSRGAHAGRVSAGLGLLLSISFALEILMRYQSMHELIGRLYLAAFVLWPAALMQAAHAVRNVEVQRHHLTVVNWLVAGLFAATAGFGDLMFAGFKDGLWGRNLVPGELLPVAATWAGAVIFALIADGLMQLLAADDADERRRAGTMVLVVCGFALAGINWLHLQGQALPPWGFVPAILAYLGLSIFLWRVGGPRSVARLLTHATLDDAQDAVLLIDGSGRIQLANLAAERVLRRSRRQLLGTSLRETLGVDHAHFQALAGIRSSSQVERVRLPQGPREPRREIEVQPLMLRDGSGQPIATLALLRMARVAGPGSLDLARPDPLLPGAELFEALLDRELRLRTGGGGSPGALMLVAIEGTQRVAQDHGPRGFAELQQAIRERLDVICDWPIDVAGLRDGIYGILLIGLSSSEEVKSIAERAAQALEAPYRVGDDDIELPAQISVIQDLRLYQDTAQVMADAETGLESVRRGAEATPLLLQYRGRADAAFNIEAAISNDALDIEYRPVINLQDRNVAGFRLGLRWSPLGIPPLDTQEVQRLARRSHVDEMLMNWILTKVMKDIQEWKPTAQAPQPKIWLPLSIDDLRRNSLIASVRKALMATEIEPGALIAEVSARDLLRPGIRASVMQLGGTGVRIHLNDFSDGVLPGLQADRLNAYSGSVEPALVRAVGDNVPARMLLKGVQLTAHALGMRLLAEGVATADELRGLVSAEITFAQGPHIGAPLDHEKVQAWLTASRQMRSLFGGAQGA